MAEPQSTIYPSNVTFYNFTAIIPADGHCEWKFLGGVGPIKELGPAIFGIITALQGIFGLNNSDNVSVGSRYVFSLLFGYGVMSALHTATLWNGFLKTSDAILNLMQAVIIMRLANTMKFPPFSTAIQYQYVAALLMTTVGIYPIIAHVIGASFENSWIAWLTFDLIWAVVLLINVAIFIHRKKYPQYDVCPDMFYLSANATVTCVTAYAFWLIDMFLCVEWVAKLQFYGFWLFLMGLTFYYFICLDIFLQSAWHGFQPEIVRWPKKYIMVFVYVQWVKKEKKQ